jgi:hypothetical protein
MAKAPAQIRSLARAHTERAIQVLQGIMDQPDCTPAARVQAATALLDRGWGKPTQHIAGDDESDPIRLIQAIERKIIDPNGDTGNSNGSESDG